MCWQTVENNCKAVYQYEFIRGKNPIERKIIIQLIADEFPEFSRMKIADAVDRCIVSNSEPMSPNAFLTYVERYLR